MPHDISFDPLVAPGVAQAKRGTSLRLLRLLKAALEADEFAGRPGFLQLRDARFKVAASFALILATGLAQRPITLVVLLGISFGLAMASRIPFGRLLKQVWLPVLIFTGVIAAPAPFVVAGDALFTVPGLGLVASEQGLRSAITLVLRAETAASLALLLILTTRWTTLLKALNSLGLPVVIIATLTMTHRYIFVFLQHAADMLEGQRSRMMASLSPAIRRRMAVASAGVLLSQSFATGQQVHLAMLARGYRGVPKQLDEFSSGIVDWCFLGIALAVVLAVIAMAA